MFFFYDNSISFAWSIIIYVILNHDHPLIKLNISEERSKQVSRSISQLKSSDQSAASVPRVECWNVAHLNFGHGRPGAHAAEESIYDPHQDSRNRCYNLRYFQFMHSSTLRIHSLLSNNFNVFFGIHSSLQTCSVNGFD